MRAGIVRVLQEAGVSVVGEASDLAGLLRLVVHEAPDVAIVDIRMPPNYLDEGIVAAERIRAEHPRTGVLILSQHVELDLVRPLLESGSNIGYLLKDRVLDIDTLVSAIQRIHAGDCVIDSTVVHQLLTRRARPEPLSTLTEREHEVLDLIAQGLLNQAIAQRLFISERTVEVHIRQIFNKLNLIDPTSGNRRVLAVLAYLEGRRPERTGDC